MLLEIREKVQGVFASIILVLICVLFGLWGIQNYLGGGKEAPVVSVGGKEFFQRDVTQAYQQFTQNLAGMKFDEETVKKQALDKLIRDEVLLQYAQQQNLVITDDSAKNFIQSLEYFQKDGKFDKTQYQTLLGSQGMSSDEFVNRIKKALIMEQVQKAIVDSGFVTPAEVDAFYKIQNQQRDVDYINVPISNALVTPSESEIADYYQSHLDAFKSEEQVSVQFVELSLDHLAKDIDVSAEQLADYYEEQKSQFSTPERRKISHILFAFNADKASEQQALQRALDAKQALKTKDFAALANEISDDKLSAKNGGDLGLFNVGVMEKAFEEAASRLKLGEISEPVKSAFGYHLIKVTELVPAEVKPLQSVKTEIAQAYKKSQAENKFAELGEKLAQISYENPDSLDAAAKFLGIDIMESAMFTRHAGDGIANDEKVRLAAFSDDVLKGSNSEPIEIGNDKLIVLRMKSHVPAENKALSEVQAQVIAAIQKNKAAEKTAVIANQIKDDLLAGKTIHEAAQNANLVDKKITHLTRTTADVQPEMIQAVFRAAKPGADRPSVIVIDEPNGGKLVASIHAVKEGQMMEADKAKQSIIQKNMATAFGKAQFEALLNQLQANADINIRTLKP